MDNAGDPMKGCTLRGGRMLKFSYKCLYDLLSIVPSLLNLNKPVMVETDDSTRFGRIRHMRIRDSSLKQGRDQTF